LFEQAAWIKPVALSADLQLRQFPKNTANLKASWHHLERLPAARRHSQVRSRIDIGAAINQQLCHFKIAVFVREMEGFFDALSNNLCLHRRRLTDSMRNRCGRAEP
jgi:hypothetical protein